MKKKIIKRSLLGFPLGITMGYLITIWISLGWANGYYSPCVPELISLMGNEINAVIFQTILCGILGVGFAASSVIGFLIYFGIFALIFVVIWIIQFGIGRYNVRKMNEKLSQAKDNRNE